MKDFSMPVKSLFKKKTAFIAFLEPHGIELEVPRGKTILQAALEQGIALPHNCRVGSCTTCKCKLLKGKVKELTDSAYVLSLEDLDHGYVLACQSRLKSDVRVLVGELVEHLPEQFKATITGERILTHDIKEIQVALDRPIFFRAGQFADILTSHLERARSYSFAVPPEDGGNLEIAFQIRHVPGGAFTDWLFGENRIGTNLILNGPAGQFYLRDSIRPVLCIAGGSGMAPIQSLLLDISNQKVSRDVTYLFGARTQRDLFSLDIMDDLKERWRGNFDFIPLLSEEQADSDWDGARGMVTDQIPEILTTNTDPDVYLCGPAGMIDAAIEKLRNVIPMKHIYSDRFTDASHS